MFGKLCKHEFKGIAKFALPLLLALGIAGVFICVFLGFNLNSLLNDGLYVDFIGQSIMIILLVLSIVAVSVVTVVAEILLFMRYYKSTMTEEGYLTFTLPVKTHEILLSKILMAIVWMLIIGVVDGIILASAGCTVYFTLPEEMLGEILAEFWGAITEITQILNVLFKDATFVSLLVAYGLQSLLTIPYTIMLFYTVITVGATINKKNKIIVMIALYFAWMAVSNVVNSVVGLPNMEFIFGVDAMFGSLDFLSVSLMVRSWVLVLLQIGVCVGFFFLDKFLLEKKLNI